LNKTTVCKSER